MRTTLAIAYRTNVGAMPNAANLIGFNAVASSSINDTDVSDALGCDYAGANAAPNCISIYLTTSNKSGPDTIVPHCVGATPDGHRLTFGVALSGNNV